VAEKVLRIEIYQEAAQPSAQQYNSYYLQELPGKA
jgi:hypothetical protein